MKSLAIFVSFVMLLIAGTSNAQSDGDGEQIWIPTAEKGFFGAIKEIKLEATLYRPRGAGPFPVLIFNHGYASGIGRSIRYYSFSQFVAERGIAVILPMRKGIAGSGGSPNEPYTCDGGQNHGGMNDAIDAIDAAVAYVKSQPFLDIKRLLIGGNSRGGIASAVYAARRPDLSIKGVVNFVGTWNNDRDCSYDINSALFSEAGGAKSPMIWLYGENDRLNTNNSLKGYAEIFKRAGGNVVFHLYAHDFADGHALLLQGEKFWSPDLGLFLSHLGFTPIPKN